MSTKKGAKAKPCGSGYWDVNDYYGCQLEKGHSGKHRWGIAWSDEEADR